LSDEYESEIFVTEHFRFVANGTDRCWRQCIRLSRIFVREAVAVAAVAAGVALRMDSPQGRAAFDEAQRQRAGICVTASPAPGSILTYHNLGDPLGIFEGRAIPKFPLPV